MPEKEIGKVSHWYDKIGVAVVKLTAPLKVGDVVKVRHGEKEFDATVESMQLEHETITSGKKGDEVAIKLPQQAKEGATIYGV